MHEPDYWYYLYHPVHGVLHNVWHDSLSFVNELNYLYGASRFHANTITGAIKNYETASQIDDARAKDLLVIRFDFNAPRAEFEIISPIALKIIYCETEEDRLAMARQMVLDEMEEYSNSTDDRMLRMAIEMSGFEDDHHVKAATKHDINMFDSHVGVFPLSNHAYAIMMSIRSHLSSPGSKTPNPNFAEEVTRLFAKYVEDIFGEDDSAGLYTYRYLNYMFFDDPQKTMLYKLSAKYEFKMFDMKQEIQKRLDLQYVKWGKAPDNIQIDRGKSRVSLKS